MRSPSVSAQALVEALYSAADTSFDRDNVNAVLLKSDRSLLSL